MKNFSMFKRSYDLSCVLSENERSYIQNAINGVNAACSETVDAWSYVERGNLSYDVKRLLGDHDHIPRTIFAAMEADLHSGFSASWTVSTLETIAQSYETWRIMREQENSRQEGSTNFWNAWRNMKLTPYYSNSGNASRACIGAILEDFLSIKSFRNEGYSQIRDNIEKELMDYIGQNLEGQISVLSEIVSLEHSPHCSNLLTRLKRRHEEEVSRKENHDKMVKNALEQLSAAIESRNPTALKAALNPGWGSMAFNSSELYRIGSKLLSELS